MLNSFYSLELHICGIVILLMTMGRSRRSILRDTRWKYFIRFQRWVFAYIFLDGLSDGLSMVTDCEYAVLAQSCTHSLAVILFFVAGYYWHLLTLSTLKPENDIREGARVLLAAIGVFAALSIASIITGWSYTSYLRPQEPPKAPWFHSACCLAVVLYTRIQLQRLMNISKESVALRRQAMIAMVCGYCILFGVAIQAIWRGSDGQIIAVVVGILYIYVDTVASLTSTDTLTHINNRQNLITYIDDKMKNLKSSRKSTPVEVWDDEQKESLYAIMIDVNLFKKINDQYGHVVGDEALVRIADSIKAVAGRIQNRPFIARYGGDEFVVIAECEDRQDILNICDDITKELNERNERAEHAKELSVSIGYAEYDYKTMKHPQDIIEAADAMMYEVKEKSR